MKKKKMIHPEKSKVVDDAKKRIVKAFMCSKVFYLSCNPEFYQVALAYEYEKYKQNNTRETKISFQ